MVMLPFTIPEDPIPATAHPMISMFEDVATPHSRDPSSKRRMKLRKTYCDLLTAACGDMIITTYFRAEMSV
jgi:hypothetical protein